MCVDALVCLYLLTFLTLQVVNVLVICYAIDNSRTVIYGYWLCYGYLWYLWLVILLSMFRQNAHVSLNAPHLSVPVFSLFHMAYIANRLFYERIE